MANLEIICCDCRTAPDIEGYMFPRFEVTRIHCPDCRKDLEGEEANRMALDEVEYLERRQLMQKRPVSLGGVAVRYESRKPAESRTVHLRETEFVAFRRSSLHS